MELLGVVLGIMVGLIIFRKRKRNPAYVTRHRKTGYVDPTALIRVFSEKGLNSKRSLLIRNK